MAGLSVVLGCGRQAAVVRLAIVTAAVVVAAVVVVFVVTAVVGADLAAKRHDGTARRPLARAPRFVRMFALRG